MSDNGDMLFSKVTDRNEPTKSAGQLSFLTTKGTVVLYEEESKLQWIEEKILITEKVIDSEVYIQISPYRNSKHKILTTQTQEIKIPDNIFFGD